MNTLETLNLAVTEAQARLAAADQAWEALLVQPGTDRDQMIAAKNEHRAAYDAEKDARIALNRYEMGYTN